MRAEPPSAELDFGHEVVNRPDFVAVHRVLRWRCRPDDPELRAAIEAAPQVVSRKPGLDALLDPIAVRGERDRVAVWLTSASMYDWAAAIGRRRKPPLDALDDGAGGQRAAAHMVINAVL